MKQRRQYEEIGPVSRACADDILANGDTESKARVLISIGLHENDWQWAQQTALAFLQCGNEQLVSAAILCIAHSTRLNGSVVSTIIPAFQSICNDNRYAGKVQDAMDDIEMFAK